MYSFICTNQGQRYIPSLVMPGTNEGTNEGELGLIERLHSQIGPGFNSLRMPIQKTATACNVKWKSQLTFSGTEMADVITIRLITNNIREERLKSVFNIEIARKL